MQQAKSFTLRPTSALAAELLPAPGYGIPKPGALLVPDPSRRQPVGFKSDGIALAGHLYRPPKVEPAQPTPGIVMCGPISSVKEMTLPHYAERFADAGYTVLTFDPRSLGESGTAPGRPRWHYDPAEVIRDYHNAVNYMMTRDDIDATRVAAVGVCMGGGYTVSLAARDHRLKAAVCVAGGSDSGDYFQKWMGQEAFANYLTQINRLVQHEYETGEFQYIPTIARTLDAETPIAIMPFSAAFEYYDRTAKAEAPHWSYKMTAASIPAWFAFSSVRQAAMVAPTPLLMVHGTRDVELPPEYMVDVYQAATGPKQFVWIESDDHFQFYNQTPWVPTAASQIIEWLAEL